MALLFAFSIFPEGPCLLRLVESSYGSFPSPIIMCRAGDEVIIFIREEKTGSGDIIRSSDPAGWLAEGGRFPGAASSLRFRSTRTDDIDPDLVHGERDGQCMGESYDPALGGRVGFSVWF